MAIEVQLPDIGAESGEVTEILVAVGDSVEADAPLMVVEGEKAAIEIPSPEAGNITGIEVKVGDKISSGALIVTMEGDASTVKEEATTASPSAGSRVETVKVTLPDVGADTVEVTEVMVAAGDTVEKDQPIVVVEGEKAAVEVPSPHDGVIQEIKVASGDSVSSGAVLLIMEVEIAAAIPKPAPVTTVAQPPASAPQQEQVSQSGFVLNQQYAHASPSVRRIAREFGVNLARVRGSGRKDRILKIDVQNYVKEALRTLESGVGSGLDLLPWPEVDFTKFGDVKTEKLSKIKRVTGANLHRNWVKIPHITQWDEADVTELEALRKLLNAAEAKQESGVKFTILVFVMKALADALLKLPAMNSSLTPDEQGIVVKSYVNLGIAVDTPNGLVVPVVRDVHKKDCTELTRDLMECSGRARAGKLTKNEMSGGTFTISSLGGLGGTQFTPIINAPEVGILGLSRSEQKPIWSGDAFLPRLMLPLSLSYDHRVIDGAEGVRFLNQFKLSLSELTKDLQG
jgi:pyruvate dehydrogenase E2 component (dihydrolipoamide acetyltransferase)